MTEQTKEVPQAFQDFNEALTKLNTEHPDTSIVAVASQDDSLSRFITTNHGVMEAVQILMDTLNVVFQSIDKGNVNYSVLTSILAVIQQAKPEEATMEAKAVKELLTFITTNQTISAIVKDYNSKVEGSNDANA